MKKILLILLLTLCLLLAGCAVQENPTVTPAAEPTANPTVEPTQEPVMDWQDGQETVQFTVDGQETDAYLAIEDKGVAFYADETEQRQIAFCEYPVFDGELGAYKSCDCMDYNEDVLTDPTINFENACFMWLSENGQLIFNPEFSTIPGDAGARGDD